jgi:hypothetical protein
MSTIIISDSTSNMLLVLGDIIHEWETLRRRGKLILHFDGNGPKKVEFNYSLDI